MGIQHPIAVGVDPHADTLSAAAVDGAGAVVWELTVPNSPEGISQLLTCSNAEPLRWAVEGTGTFGRALTDRLLQDGAAVFEVPTRLTGRLRRRAGFGKTDRIDAVTIARAALSEPLATVTHQPLTEALRVLIRQREALVAAQVQALNRLRARLREIDPAAARQLGRIRSKATLTSLSHHTIDSTNPHHQALTLAIRLDATDTLTRHQHIHTLETRIRQLLPPAGHTLMNIPGVGLIGAATLIAHTGDIRRFPTDAHYATYCGTAPVDASSGRQQRHRLNRWGNRSLNRVIHIAIVTQLQQHGPAAGYITRRIQEGKTKPEAIRTAKRHLTRHIYRTLKQHPLT